MHCSIKVFIILFYCSIQAMEIPLGKQEVDQDVNNNNVKTAYSRDEDYYVAMMLSQNTHSSPPSLNMIKKINKSHDDHYSCKKECSAFCSFVWEQCINGPGCLNPHYGYASVNLSPK